MGTKEKNSARSGGNGFAFAKGDTWRQAFRIMKRKGKKGKIETVLRLWNTQKKGKDIKRIKTITCEHVWEGKLRPKKRG